MVARQAETTHSISKGGQKLTVEPTPYLIRPVRKSSRQLRRFPGAPGISVGIIDQPQHVPNHLIVVPMPKMDSARALCVFEVVVVGVSFISRFRLRPLMGTRQERPGMYLS